MYIESLSQQPSGRHSTSSTQGQSDLSGLQHIPENQYPSYVTISKGMHYCLWLRCIHSSVMQQICSCSKTVLPHVVNYFVPSPIILSLSAPCLHTVTSIAVTIPIPLPLCYPSHPGKPRFMLMCFLNTFQ